MAYKITDRIELNVTGMFQYAANVLFAAEAEYLHINERGGYQNTVTATSKADGLTFNVGVNYHFGKRKPKE